MINQCIEYQDQYRLSLHYDADHIMQLAIERTQAAATNMADSQGNDRYEAMSATTDNAWMLHRYIDNAWLDIVESCRAYLSCAPTMPEANEPTQYFTIVLLLPLSWDVANAVTIDRAIQDYITSSVTRDWWIDKAMADQAAIQENLINSRKSEIRYSLNYRRPTTIGRPTRYF